MIRSIYSAATGMKAQQMYVDNISNNLANVNTVGFKKARLDFQDLMYQTIEAPGESVSETASNPTGLQVGLGVKVSGNQKMFTQGSLTETDQKYDMAIQGDGFFQIMNPNGTLSYTRDGSFKINDQGQLTNSQGYLLEPEVTLPTDADPSTFSISNDGVVSVQLIGQTTTQQLAQLELAKFVNPAGLMSMGGNLYNATPASGAPIINPPGQENMGTVAEGELEQSNVQIVEEMVNMIMAQRAYEISSKGVTTSDQMLQTANQLKS